MASDRSLSARLVYSSSLPRGGRGPLTELVINTRVPVLRVLGWGLAQREHSLQWDARCVSSSVFAVSVLLFCHLMTGAESLLTLGIVVVLVWVTD